VTEGTVSDRAALMARTVVFAMDPNSHEALLRPAGWRECADMRASSAVAGVRRASLDGA